MNSPGERKDELGAHDTCDLGFESQGNEEREDMSSGEVGLHEEKKVASFGFESQRQEKENEEDIMVATSEATMNSLEERASRTSRRPRSRSPCRRLCAWSTMRERKSR